MLDRNIRTEYGHLQRIGALSGTAVAERRELFQTILGEGRIRSEIVEQLGVKSLASHTHFLSLLYFLGMLTMGTSPRSGHGRAREDRAVPGAVPHAGDPGVQQPGHAGLDEKTIKLLLMTYASLGRAFLPLSEKEFAQGYGDLFLGASRDVAGARYSWLLELEYLTTGAKAGQIEAAFEEAEAQVRRYSSDQALLPLLLGERELKAGMLVFVGAKKGAVSGVGGGGAE